MSQLNSRKQWICIPCQMHLVDNPNIDLPLCVPERRGVHRLLELVEDGELYQEGATAHMRLD